MSAFSAFLAANAGGYEITISGQRRASAAPVVSKTYPKYGAALYHKFVAHAEKQKGKRVFYMRYKQHKGPKIERVGGELCFVHPDNPKNKFKVTEKNFTCAMLRTRHDYELARGKQPNMAKKGCSFKEGFHKNVKPNNVTYNAAGEGMAKWKTAAYWGDDETRGTSGTVNEKAFDFITGTVNEKAFDFITGKIVHIADVEREVHDLCDSEEEGDEEEGSVGGGGASASTGLRGLHDQQQKQHLAQVKQELSVAESRLQCAVCMEAERDTVFVPCNHVVTCAGCAARVQTCPVCRAAIGSKLPVNMS